MNRCFRPKLIFAIVCLLTGLALSPLHAQNRDAAWVDSPDRRLEAAPLDTVVYSPDGRRIAFGGRDNIVHIIDSYTGELHGYLTGHDAWVTQIAFSPDSTMIATGSHDNSVRLWDLGRFREIQRLTHHTGQVTGVAFSPGGRLLATGSLDGTIWVGEAETGNEIATLINYSGPVWSIAFSPDGGSLVSGSEDGTIWWWGLYDSSVTKLDGHTGAITALTFSPDRRYLATSSWDRTVRLWDVLTGEIIHVLEGHQGPVTDVVFYADGSQLVSSGLDSSLRVWGVADGSLRAVLQAEAPLAGLSVHPQDNQVVSAGIYGVLEIWDVSGRVDALVQALPTYTPPPVVVQQPPTRIPATAVPFSTPVPGDPAPPPPTDLPAPPPAVVSSGGPMLAAPTVNLFSTITTFPLDGVSWAIDPWESMVGHFQGTTWLDGAGNIVLGGHSLYPDGSRGVFNGLYGLNIGDPIIVTVNGGERRYVVSEKFTVHYENVSVVYPTSAPRLTLITCDIPTWNPNTQNYDQRLVVVAVPG